MISFLLSPAKIPWALCTVFSFIYFWLFTEVSKDKFPNLHTGLLGGFCVWGEPENPLPDVGCTTNINSHMVAFIEDCFMTAIVVFLYFTRGQETKKKHDEDDGNVVFLYVAIGGIIFFHGLLHFFLSVSLKCLTSNAPSWLEPIGWFLYLVFTFSLSVVIIGLGFADHIGWIMVGVASGVVAGITYLLAHGSVASAGTEWLLPALFATSHPIGSVTGWLSTSDRFSYMMGWLFLLATLDGIVELMRCESFLKEYGGHIWYDIFLHLAVITVLPGVWR